MTPLVSAYLYFGKMILHDPEDFDTVIEAICDEAVRRSVNKFCEQGPRVVYRKRVMPLATAILPHERGEVVRPVNGNWLDVRKDNLVAVHP